MIHTLSLLLIGLLIYYLSIQDSKLVVKQTSGGLQQNKTWDNTIRKKQTRIFPVFMIPL